MRQFLDVFADEPRLREPAPRGQDAEGGGRRPPGSTRPPGGPNDGARGFGDSLRRAGRGAATAIAVVLVLLLLLLFVVGIDLWTDALWFASVGYDDVFWARLGAQAALFAGTLALALAVLLGSVWIASRFSPKPGDGSSSLERLFERLNEAAQAAERGQNPWSRDPRWQGPGGEPRNITPEFGAAPDVTPIARLVIAGIAVFIALGLAGSVAASWETVLLWQHRVPFSTASTVADPVFGRDISFFLFDLPFLRLVQAVFNGIVVGALLVTLARYGVGALVGRLELTTPVRVHFGILGALVLASVAVGYQLDKLELAYSARGVATGVSYTDASAQFLAYDVLTVVSGLAAVLLVAGAFTKLLWPLGLTLAVWFIASIVVGRLYPAAIQQFTVVPNQYAQEEPYIANNIAMTRLAFGLDQWEDRPFRGEDALTVEAIVDEDVTFRNARLWDYRPLGASLDQLQTVRRYYDFHDVDTDRYVIDDVQRQVMLSARELALDKDPKPGFVNQRIVYTHGIGVAMVPVNEVANEGQPRLLIRNLPPVSSAGVPEISEPRIYFGERPSDWVITGARQAEFDYPTGEGEGSDEAGTETRWAGETGVRLDNPVMRLLFALRLRDMSLLISDQITVDSQLLFHRSLGDRLPRIAPFLRYDKDPYVVVSDGRLVYVQDAFTVSDRFPHAQYFDPAQLEGSGLGPGAFNYLRNSVKITMDAYDGTMRFYVADDTDPLIRAYANVFPTLFRPLDELPDELDAHLRVPEELFNVQTRMFGRYHVTNTLRFFQNDDLWTVPQGQGSSQSLPSEAYYVVMRMPGEPEPEFLLLQPMVPNKRPNMIAWVAARNDAPNYGATRVYRFPADTTVFGPGQIEARITQDPAISQQITLWSQSGSDVIRGNLIVVPIRDSLLYLQPIYLQAQASAFPEFRRIVVASPREVVWGESLGEALELLLAADQGGGPSPSPGPSPTPAPTPTPAPSGSPGPSPSLPADVAALISYANEHFDRAQEALRDGDFARYGEEMALVEAALQQLSELTGGAPVASPSPTP
jgi:uncharacterized membrane protein (UPF0182 family)